MRYSALISIISTICFYLPAEAQYWSDSMDAAGSVASPAQAGDGSTGVSGLITPEEVGLDAPGQSAGSGVSGLISPEEIGLPADKPQFAPGGSSYGHHQQTGQSQWIHPQQQSTGSGAQGTSYGGQPDFAQQMQAPPGSYLGGNSGSSPVETQQSGQQPYPGGGFSGSQTSRFYPRESNSDQNQGIGQSQWISPGQSQRGLNAQNYGGGGQVPPGGYGQGYGQSQLLNPAQIRQGTLPSSAGIGQSGLVGADGQPVQNVQQQSQRPSSPRKRSSRRRGMGNTFSRTLKRGLGKGMGGGMKGFGF